MAPLVNELRPDGGCFPPHLGPVTPEVSSIWFKMFLYKTCGAGPPSLLLPKGYKISRLPPVFEQYSRLLVTTWGHDPSEIPLSGALPLLMEALLHSAVLIQGYASQDFAEPETKNVPFPLSTKDQGSELSFPTICPYLMSISKSLNMIFNISDQLERDLPWWKTKNGLKALPAAVDVRNCCGYVTLIKLNISNDNDHGAPKNGDMNDEDANLLMEEVDSISETSGAARSKLNLPLTESSHGQWMLLDVKFGIPLFDSDLNKEICQRITINSLWNRESLACLEKTGKELCLLLDDFIDEQQDLPFNDANDKIWMTPEERKKSPVPLPTRALFFDGRNLLNGL